MTPAPSRSSIGSRLGPYLVIALFSLAVRVAVLPLATADGGDAASRVWIAQNWLSQPKLLTEGVWGPLHFYLLGLVLAVVPDPVYGAIGFGILVSTASALLLYRFVEMEFADRPAALLVGLTYAFYPVAIRNGVSVRSETPFVFFLLLALLALALARRVGGSWRHAAAGGVALTLASMLRYEGWMLTPMLALLLWRKPRLALVFVGCSLIHPIFWMAGNTIAHGDPFFGVTAASRFELETMGRGHVNRGLLIGLAVRYPVKVLRYMGLVAAGISLVGAVRALLDRDRSAAWLVPLAGLLSLECLAVAQGSLVPKLNYTETAGTMLFPFGAPFYRRLQLESRTVTAVSLLAAGLVAANSVFFCEACFARIGLATIASSPVPRVPHQDTALGLLRVISEQMPTDGGLISDDFGSGTTREVALRTRLPRSRMYLVCGAAKPGADVQGLAKFVGEHPTGLLLARSGSRFSADLRVTSSTVSARIGERGVTLVPLRRVGWFDQTPTTLTVFRYSTTGSTTGSTSYDPAFPSTPGCSPRDAARGHEVSGGDE